MPQAQKRERSFRAQSSAAPLKQWWQDVQDTRTSHIPRSIERGPVEAETLRVAIHSRARIPRSIERGPVEAVVSSVMNSCMLCIPRSIERGPVEAKKYGFLSTSHRPSFRAQSSAAPLKQSFGVPGDGVALCIPRSIERGPVEACH